MKRGKEKAVSDDEREQRGKKIELDQDKQKRNKNQGRVKGRKE